MIFFIYLTCYYDNNCFLTKAMFVNCYKHKVFLINYKHGQVIK